MAKPILTPSSTTNKSILPISGTYENVVAALPYQPQMALETGFTKHILSQKPTTTTFFQRSCLGMFILTEIRRGLRMRQKTCHADKSHKS